MESISRRTFLQSGAAGTLLTVTGCSSHSGLTFDSQPPENGYRTLGPTGFRVCEIGMGCMNMRDPELVHAAIDSGMNYLDTADTYMNGINEETIGQVMKTKRDRVFLTTKIEPVTSIERSRTDVENSLKRLQTDHVDLLLIHHGGETPEQVMNENNMKALDEARQKGQTRFVGFSAHASDPEVYETAIGCGFYDAVSLCYNYASPQHLTTSIERMRKAGIAVIAMKNLLNFNTMPRIPIDDIRNEKNDSVTHTQALLQWVLANPYVDVTIPGITAFEHITENMAIVGTKMAAGSRRMLNRFDRSIKGTYCMGLSGCSGCRNQCPYGVQVHEINRCLGYAYGYGDVRLARENYRRLPKTSTIHACSNCTECTVKCVNGLDLTQNMRRARELFS